jgi:hypothetical protein
MHIHTNNDCQHDLRVCATCGDAYCTKCGKTWFREQFSCPPNYPYIYYGQPYTITTDTKTYGDTSRTYHAHS